jgi:hypothetical protein
MRELTAAGVTASELTEYHSPRCGHTPAGRRGPGGGYLVLSAGNDVYRLDRSDLVHGFEGRRVVIQGVLDPKLKQIHVLKIDLEQKP